MPNTPPKRQRMPSKKEAKDINERREKAGMSHIFSGSVPQNDSLNQLKNLPHVSELGLEKINRDIKENHILNHFVDNLSNFANQYSKLFVQKKQMEKKGEDTDKISSELDKIASSYNPMNKTHTLISDYELSNEKLNKYIKEYNIKIPSDSYIKPGVLNENKKNEILKAHLTNYRDSYLRRITTDSAMMSQNPEIFENKNVPKIRQREYDKFKDMYSERVSKYETALNKIKKGDFNEQDRKEWEKYFDINYNYLEPTITSNSEFLYSPPFISPDISYKVPTPPELKRTNPFYDKKNRSLPIYKKAVTVQKYLKNQISSLTKKRNELDKILSKNTKKVSSLTGNEYFYFDKVREVNKQSDELDKLDKEIKTLEKDVKLLNKNKINLDRVRKLYNKHIDEKGNNTRLTTLHNPIDQYPVGDVEEDIVPIVRDSPINPPPSSINPNYIPMLPAGEFEYDKPTGIGDGIYKAPPVQTEQPIYAPQEPLFVEPEEIEQYPDGDVQTYRQPFFPSHLKPIPEAAPDEEYEKEPVKKIVPNKDLRKRANSSAKGGFLNFLNEEERKKGNMFRHSQNKINKSLSKAGKYVKNDIRKNLDYNNLRPINVDELPQEYVIPSPPFNVGDDGQQYLAGFENEKKYPKNLPFFENVINNLNDDIRLDLNNKNKALQGVAQAPVKLENQLQNEFKQNAQVNNPVRAIKDQFSPLFKKDVTIAAPPVPTVIGDNGQKYLAGFKNDEKYRIEPTFVDRLRDDFTIGLKNQNDAIRNVIEKPINSIVQGQNALLQNQEKGLNAAGNIFGEEAAQMGQQQDKFFKGVGKKAQDSWQKGVNMYVDNERKAHEDMNRVRGFIGNVAKEGGNRLVKKTKDTLNEEWQELKDKMLPSGKTVGKAALGVGGAVLLAGLIGWLYNKYKKNKQEKEEKKKKEEENKRFAETIGNVLKEKGYVPQAPYSGQPVQLQPPTPLRRERRGNKRS